MRTPEQDAVIYLQQEANRLREKMERLRKSRVKEIWKFRIPTDRFTLRMPQGAQILSLQVQNERPCIWALVDPSGPPEIRQFCTFGTGHPVTGAGDFIGTYQLDGGQLVFHVFEVELP